MELAEVELPEALRERPSMFFCIGPHAMFSNIGNGIGRITFAPVTNFGTTIENKMPNTPEQPFERWLNEGLNEEEIKHYGTEIIAGVSRYIPQMSDAKIRNVIAGIVKSKGEVDIHGKDSSFHKRDYDGVEEGQIGWVDNAAMKLFYCLGNAKKVAEIIQKQEVAKRDIGRILNSITRDTEDGIGSHDELRERIFGQFLINYLQRNHDSKFFSTHGEEKIARQYRSTFEKKKLLLEELRQKDTSALLRPPAPSPEASSAKRVAIEKPKNLAESK